MPRSKPNPFMDGFAVAVADLVRLHDAPSMAADVIAGHGFTIASFSGCDPYDLKVIRKLFKEEYVLRRREALKSACERTAIAIMSRS